MKMDMAGDTYIHFNIAKNIADRNSYSYNFPEKTNCSTSPLWTFTLGLIFKINSNSNIRVILAKIFSLILHLTNVIVVVALFKDEIAIEAMIFICIWILLNPSYLCWSFRAMETSLCLLLVTTLMYAIKSSCPIICVSTIVFLIYLTRPEFLILAPFTFIYFYLIDNFTFDSAIKFLIYYIIYFFVYQCWIYKNTKTFLPTSHARIYHYRQYAIKLFANFYFNKEDHPIKYLLKTYHLPILVALIYVLLNSDINPIIINPFVIILAPSLIVFLLFFTFVMPGNDYGGRYYLPSSYLILLLLIDLSVKGNLTIVLPIVFSISIWMQIEESNKLSNFACNYVIAEDVRIRMAVAKWLGENLGKREKILCKEIDAIKFYNDDIDVISIDGLLNLRDSFVMDESGLYALEIIKNKNPNYILIEGNIYESYPFWSKTWMCKLADTKIMEGETINIHGYRFLKLKSFQFRSYVDMYGTKSNSLSEWSIFQIVNQA
jgi:hypothetical protein